MADYDFTFDGVKQFIADRGGRVRNVELVTHFRQHLNDPARKAEARELFKDFVNNVAVIRQEEGEKFLVLKKKYREPSAQVSRVRPLAVEELEYTGEEPQNNYPYQPPEQPSSYLAFQEPPLPPPPALASPVRRDWDVPAPPAEQEGGGSPAGWQPPYQQPDLVRRQPSFNDYNQQPPYDEPEIIRRQPSFNQPPSPYELNEEPLPVNRQSSFKEPVSVARKPSFEKAITHNQFPPHEPPPSPLDDAHSPTFKRPSPPAQSQNGGPKSELQLPRSDSSSRMETGSSRSDTVSIRSDTASISEKGEAEDDGYGSNVSSVALDVLEKEWMLKAAVGNVSALRRLLSQDPNLASKKDFVSTALHWGAKHGNQEIVALMADAGLDVNLRTGYTPLHLAAMYGHDHIVKLLIDAYDADVTIRDYSGRRPGQRLRPGSSTNVDEVVQRKKQRSSSLSSFNPRHSMKDFKELVTTIGSALKMKAPPKHH